MVVAIRLFRRHYHRRTLCLAHRLVAGFEGCASTDNLDDDGLVARYQLHRQFRRWLARQLLELHGQDELLHHDRCCRWERWYGDLVLRSPAQGHPATSAALRDGGSVKQANYFLGRGYANLPS